MPNTKSRRKNESLIAESQFFPNAPIFIIKNSSRRTMFDLNIDYGSSKGETDEYAFKIADDICSVMSSSYPSYFLSDFVNDKNNATALCRNDGVRRPQFGLYSLFNTLMPSSGYVYKQTTPPLLTLPPMTTDVVPDDQTLKMLIVNGNTFCFMLSRSQSIDNNNGKVSLKIKNQQQWVNMTTCTLLFDCFPNNRSLTNVGYDYNMDDDGTLQIELDGLPYFCVIFIRGDMYI